jgi:hypothetical protein
MSLLTDCLRGMTVNSTYRNPYVLDFAVVSPKAVALLEMNWWRSDWGIGTGLDVVEFPLIRGAGSWKIDRQDDPILLDPLEDDGFTDIFNSGRKWQELEPDEHLSQLEKLSLFLTPDGFDFAGWIEVWKLRNKAEASRRPYAPLRPVAKVLLVASTGRALDALAFDSEGNAATVAEHPWLVTLANEWSAGETGQTLAERLTWMMELSPVGEFQLSGPAIISASVSVDEVAARMFERSCC